MNELVCSSQFCRKNQQISEFVALCNFEHIIRKDYRNRKTFNKTGTNYKKENFSYMSDICF